MKNLSHATTRRRNERQQNDRTKTKESIRNAILNGFTFATPRSKPFIKFYVVLSLKYVRVQILGFQILVASSRESGFFLKRLKSVGYPLETILHKVFAKIDQKPKTTAGQTQIGKKLFGMHRHQSLY